MPRRSTPPPDDGVEPLVRALLDAAGAAENVDLLREILRAVVALAGDRSDRLDLKITSAAIREMRSAFNVFAPYREVPKATLFGSARTRRDDPLYRQAVELARGLADRGWMVVTGAGPGIMEAGMEGAGRDRAIGVLIQLPFEGGANRVIAGDEKLVTMKYFFTRKLMLIKESAAFVALPGGFGTLDEVFELLTLVQTGKAEPAPIVLLDTPGSGYWEVLDRFLAEEVGAVGMISPDDASLYRITSSVDEAIEEIERFWCNYHSLRFVGDRLVLRLRSRPADAEVDALDDEFGDLLTGGRIALTAPLAEELRSQDHLDLPRLVLRFDRRSYGRLRSLIDAINRLPSAPPPGARPPSVAEQAAVEP